MSEISVIPTGIIDSAKRDYFELPGDFRAGNQGLNQEVLNAMSILSSSRYESHRFPVER